MSMAELAAAADVPVRTVRFYISQDLLASPEGRGRAATYTEEHLERLRLIRALVDQRVPLREIKETVGPMSASDVRKLLAQEQQRSTQEDRARSRSPRDYVSALLERSKRAPSPKALSVRAIDASGPKPMTRSAAESLSEAVPWAPLPSPSGGARTPIDPAATWYRIQLAPGLELHVDGSKQEALQALVERIVELSRTHRRPPDDNRQ